MNGAQRWVAWILTRDGLRLYVKGLRPKRITTHDSALAGVFPTQEHALRMAQLLCPDGGRIGAEPVAAAQSGGRRSPDPSTPAAGPDGENG